MKTILELDDREKNLKVKYWKYPKPGITIITLDKIKNKETTKYIKIEKEFNVP